MLGLMNAAFRPFQLMKQVASRAGGGNQFASAVSTSELLTPLSLSLTSIRTKVRCYFPRPNEVKRVRRHGWEFRLSSNNGRKILMRRILKGKYVLSH